MKNYINGIYGNKITFTNTKNERWTDDVCDKLISYITNLSDNEQIALQLIPDNDSVCLTTVTDNKSSYSREDINWIFANYAKTGKITKERFAGNGCKLYALVMKGDYVPKDRFDLDTDSRRFDTGFARDLFSEIIRSGIVIQFNAFGNKQAYGRILLSIRGEITARQKAILSLVFQDMNIVSLADVYDNDCNIPIDCLSDYMSYLLKVMRNDWKDHAKECDDDDMIDSDDCSALDFFEDGFAELDDLDGDVEDDTSVEPEISTPETKKESSLSRLDELIGLEDVKEQVRKIVAYARMKKVMDESNRDNLSMALNMVFTGNPGTAKTTVARILAGIFHDIGLLKSSDIVEVGRADLIGSYVGQTAPKVIDAFKKASGKLLFIDEAYSLVDDYKSSYCDEAISAIVQEMENRRSNTIVIFAGYPDKMEEFFKMNPGLRSRVPFSIEFKDYPVDTLVEIAEKEAAKREFSISESALEKVRSLCTEASANPEFGNGRFCRNLIENAILNYAFRNFSQESDRALPKNLELTEEDFSMPKGLTKTQREKKFGFT